jgi:hypothetical protein
VVHPVKEFFQVHIDHPFATFCNVLLRLDYRLMGAATRTKTVAASRKGRIKYGIENLQDRLLDKSIQYRVGMPSRLVPPPGLGIETSLTG